MAEIPLGLVSHTRKVCSLYKRGLRNLENYYRLRHEYRYQAVLLRQRFEENRNIPDARVAKQLLLDGQEELFQKLHAQPRQFPGSPGGICYERYAEAPDSVLDFWDPIEKAQYPKFFAKREELKKEYEKLYNKLYPEPSKETPKTT